MKKDAEKPAPNNVRNLREALELTQEELAVLMGVKRLTIVDIETGKRHISKKNLARFREIFQADDQSILFPTAAVNKVIPIMGVIDEDGRLIRSENQGFVRCPDNASPSTTRAARVTADINLSLFNLHNWIIVFSTDPDVRVPMIINSQQPVYPHPNPTGERFARFIGNPCIVETVEGVMLLRNLRRGNQQGLFTLRSHNLKEEENVPIQECYPILAMFHPDEIVPVTSDKKPLSLAAVK